MHFLPVKREETLLGLYQTSRKLPMFNLNTKRAVELRVHVGCHSACGSARLHSTLSKENYNKPPLAMYIIILNAQHVVIDSCRPLSWPLKSTQTFDHLQPLY